MPAGHVLVERVEHPLDVNAGRLHRGQKHRRPGRAPGVALVPRHDDAEPGADRTGDQPFMPSMTNALAVAPCRRRQHRRVGARTGGRLGHHKARAHGAGGQRPQPSLLLVVLGDLFEKVHVGFVRGETVERHRPQGRIAGRLEHHGLAAMVEPEPAPFRPDMRGQEPRPAASATSSARNSSVGPCGVCLVSCSYGMIASRTNARCAPAIR